MKKQSETVLVSFLHSLLTDIVWDAGVSAAAGQILTNGDWSKTALLALGYAVFRTMCRELRIYLFDKPATDQ